MRSYYKVTVRTAGIIDYDIESWSEHNHSSVYSGGSPLFDGYSPEAYKVIEKEIERLVNIAKQHGMTVEVIR